MEQTVTGYTVVYRDNKDHQNYGLRTAPTKLIERVERLQNRGCTIIEVKPIY